MPGLLSCPSCGKPHHYLDVEIFTCPKCAEARWTTHDHVCPRPVYRVRNCGCVIDGSRVNLRVEKVVRETASWREFPLGGRKP